MLNFPLKKRKVAYRDNKESDDAQHKQDTHALENLSPDLSLLLSLVMKDKKNDNMMPILQSIEPFLEPDDRTSVGSFLGMSNQDNRLNNYNRTHSMNTGYQDLSKSDRQISLMQQLMRHSKGQSKSMLNNMEEMMKQQYQMGKMMKQMDAMNGDKGQNPLAMFEMLSMFMPKDSMGELKNMQNMMNLFKNMNGNDMSSFMKNFMK